MATARVCGSAITTCGLLIAFVFKGEIRHIKPGRQRAYKIPSAWVWAADKKAAEQLARAEYLKKCPDAGDEGDHRLTIEGLHHIADGDQTFLFYLGQKIRAGNELRPKQGVGMRGAVYARVSTSNNGQSPEMQLRDFSEYCSRRGWALAGEYVDIGVSGTKEKRPELDRLMADAHRRKFDVAVVWSFDRMARSVSHLLRVLETFNSLGIAFVSLREQIDTSTPAGKMIFTVLGAVAELERSLIAERVKAGLRNARAKGKRLGRPSVIVDGARIAALRASGASWRAVAKHLNMSERTIRRAAKVRQNPRD